MSIEFPLPAKQTAFDTISDPRILVAVRTPFGYVPHRFVVDTGADFALAPRDVAEEVGLEWDRLIPAQVRGVSATDVGARVGRLRLRVDTLDFIVRCLFVDSPVAPLVLGRAAFLDRFVLTFDQPGGRIILTEVS